MISDQYERVQGGKIRTIEFRSLTPISPEIAQFLGKEFP